jgi:hypothetical protein
MPPTARPARRLYAPERKPDLDDRPTVPAPFDVDAFARQAMGKVTERAAPPESMTRARPVREPEPTSASAALRTLEHSDWPRRASFADDGDLIAMRDRFAFGDYAGALALAERVLASQPENRVAREIRGKCCTTLEDVYAFSLGPLDRVPTLLMLPQSTEKTPIDHRTGFILSLVDGTSTVETIVDVCGMPRLDALGALHDLVQAGILGFR